MEKEKGNSKNKGINDECKLWTLKLSFELIFQPLIFYAKCTNFNTIQGYLKRWTSI